MRTLFSLALLLLAHAVAADVLNVPANFPTIQAAIDAAQDGDAIVLAPGTYTDTILVDRSLNISISSIDPADPLVAEQTVIADVAGGRVINAIVGTGESITVRFEGLTVRRDNADTPFAVVRSIGGNLTFDRCIIDGGTEPATSFFFAIDAIAAPLGNASLRIIDSEFGGNIGTIRADLPLTEIIGCTADSAGIGFDLRPREDQTFRMTDTTFTNTPGSPGSPIISLRRPSSPSGPLGAVELQRLTFQDLDRLVLDATSIDQIELRDFNIKGVQQNGGDIMLLSNATIEGMVIRESGGLQNDFGLIRAGTIVARNVVAEDNLSEFGVFHVTDEPLEEPQHDFIDCRFERNTSQYAVIEVHGIGRLLRCDFVENEILAGGFGNAAPFVNFGSRGSRLTGPAVIQDCRFIDNASSLSAAVVVPSGLLGPPPVDFGAEIINTQFIGNSGFAGLIDIISPNRAIEGFPKIPLLTQCLIVGNTTGNGIHTGSTRYTQCTIAGNISTNQQLGIGEAELINTLFVPADPEGVMAELITGDIAKIEASNSLVPPSIASLPTAANSVILGPLFVRAPNNGGDGWGDDPDTPDIDESANDDFGDLRLAGASPAIDAGDASLGTTLATDLDGNPRVADDPGVPGEGIDIGAYEFQDTSCLADVNQDGELSPNDFNAWVLAFNENSPLADQNRNSQITPNDFNAWILNFNGGC